MNLNRYEALMLQWLEAHLGKRDDETLNDCLRRLASQPHPTFAMLKKYKPGAPFATGLICDHDPGDEDRA